MTKSTYRKQPAAPDPVRDRRVEEVVQRLLRTDQYERQAVVNALLANPASLPVFVDALVPALKSRDPDVRRAARTTLLQVGRPALPALKSCLCRVHRGPFCVRVIETLVDIAETIDAREHVELFLALDIALCQARDEAVRLAATKALAALRRAGEHGCSGLPASGPWALE